MTLTDKKKTNKCFNITIESEIPRQNQSKTDKRKESLKKNRGCPGVGGTRQVSGGRCWTCRI